MAVCHHRLLLLLLFSCLSLRAIGSRVNITNNGYRDIVIAISPDVPSDQADDLLDSFYYSLFLLQKNFIISS
jgi:hypothetical protein